LKTLSDKYVAKKTAKSKKSPSSASNTKVQPYLFTMMGEVSKGSEDGLMEYTVYLKACLVDGVLASVELDSLLSLRSKHGITIEQHKHILQQIEYTEQDYEEAIQKV
jgi:hypothetical protein